MPNETVLPSDDPRQSIQMQVRASYNGNGSYAPAVSTPLDFTVRKRGWHVEPNPQPSQKTPLILVHGDNSEGKPQARWGPFLSQMKHYPCIEETFDTYIWYHETDGPIGFNGTSGNAADLATFVGDTGHGLLANYPEGTKVVFLAHSRGGLVVRSFMRSPSHMQNVAGLLTLGTPHHGSPFAVPDWTGVMWEQLYGPDAVSTTCFDVLVNTHDTPLDGLGFDVDRLGSLGLAWDNGDGKLNTPILQYFPVDIADEGYLMLTPGDGNVSNGGLDRTIFYSPMYKEMFGSLGDLNANSKMQLGKIVAIAAYDDSLSDNDQVTVVCDVISSESKGTAARGLIPEHYSLEIVTRLLAEMSNVGTGLATYYANDGLVPLQSGLFLDISGGARFSSLVGDEQIQLDNILIANRSQVARAYMVWGSAYGIRDHLDLLDTDNSAYWELIANELCGFLVAADRGFLRIDIEPAGVRAAGSQWRLMDGSDQEWHNSGDQTELSPGEHGVTFRDLACWQKPDDLTVTIVGGGSEIISVLYDANDCSSKDGVCTIGTCDPTTGNCEAQPIREGQACPDSLFCNGIEICRNGQCVDGVDPCIDLEHCNESLRICTCEEPSGCDDGLACTLDECDVTTGECKPSVVLGGSCLIEGVCYTTGTTSPSNDCLICDPDLDTAAWSRQPTGTTCGNRNSTVCNAADTCDEKGVCQANVSPEGMPCDDDDACTFEDNCRNGVCVGTHVNERPTVASHYPADDVIYWDGCPPDSVEIVFSENVSGPGGKALTANEFAIDGFSSSIHAFQYDELSHTATFVFDAVADASWHSIRINGTIQNGCGNPLRGNASGGTAGNGDFWIDFAVLCGDFQRDGDVDVFDRTQYLAQWTSENGVVGDNLLADFQCDGDTDVFDRTQFLTCWTRNNGAVLGSPPQH
ncbi:MAG: hypothetical protein HYR83_13225 [Planctomycetes bacterium]|nr:hypothetical protein [Planctomycetota bacterium]